MAATRRILARIVVVLPSRFEGIPLTVMEALVTGCAVISYGWGRGHVRANNAAFARHGMAQVAGDRGELGAALRTALAAGAARDPSFAALPTAAQVVLERFAGPTSTACSVT